MTSYYMPGNNLQIFWISLAIAGIFLVLMAISRKSRPALLYPIALALVAAGPYLMFLCGTSMHKRVLPTVYGALFAAPWIFIVTSAVVGFIFYFRATNEGSRTFTGQDGKTHFWWGVNLLLFFAALLTAVPYWANSDWLYMVKPLRDSIFSQGHTIRFLGLSVVLNYFIVALVLAGVLSMLGAFRSFNPAVYGGGVLLITNTLELGRVLAIAYFIYAWKDETFFMRVWEINEIFVWPLRFAGAIGVGAIVVSNVLNSKSSRSLQATSLARA